MVKSRAESYVHELGLHVVTEEHLATLSAKRFGSGGPPRPDTREDASQIAVGQAVGVPLPNPLPMPSPQSSPASGRGGEREKQLLIPAGEGANESLCEPFIKRPLAGLNIVVTRPREQAAKLAQRIGQAGGTPLLFPLLDITSVH